ncbi:MAG: hypothetical protein WC641_05555 [Patescibacteria group bacterium]
MSRFEKNPFNVPAFIAKKSGVFSSELRSAHTPQEKAIEQRFRERAHAGIKESEIERLPTVFDLHAYLEGQSHVEACASAFSCDPWKYEPILYQDLGLLLLEREDTEDELRKTDLTRLIAKLRGFIRAGSWMTYDRIDLKREMPKFDAALARHTHDLDRNLRSIQDQIDDTKLQAYDAAWSQELTDERDRLRRLAAVFKLIPEALHDGVMGDALEEAVRAFDAIYGRLSLSLRGVSAAHGSDKASDGNKNIAQLRREVDALRPLRDVLYLRRLYPNLAKLTLK